MNTRRQPPGVQPDLPGLKPIGAFLPAVRKPSRIEARLIDAGTAIAQDDPAEVWFQHTILCQTALPYRDPGDGRREWEQRQGRAALFIEAGTAIHPRTGERLRLGLPFGPKPRLILSYLNTEALRTGQADIDVQNSLTAFVGRLRLDPNGHTIRAVKDQLARLAAAKVSLSFITADDLSANFNAPIISRFDLWFAKDHRRRILWPASVRLSLDYFASLQRHAVPLDERALRALSHSSMGLDVYSWLAQRLHRIDPRRPQFIPWTALKDQFGWHYEAMFKFRQVFRHTLAQALMEYRGARVEMDAGGMTLRNSPPPVKGRFAIAHPPAGIEHRRK